MKTNLNITLGMLLATASMSGVAYANCPAGLSAEERISCIRIEGAGVFYQDYLADRAELLAHAISERTAISNQDIAVKRQDLNSKDDVEEKKFSSSLGR